MNQILSWVVSHTQVVEALYKAWETFQATNIQQEEEPEWESKKLDIEKKMNEIILQSWQEKLTDRRDS